MFEEEMTRTFIQTNEFLRQWKKLGFGEEDLRLLELMIMHNPEIGAVMQGTGGLRKMRFAYEGRGKSGSTRVCYVDFAYYDTVYLITAYAKNQKENLSKDERNSIKMSEMYESIMRGLQEAIDDAAGKKNLKRRTVTVMPIKRYSADEVKKIRKSTGMSQRLFAEYMGVSGKTVEAWEAGTNHPSGSSSRILSMIESNKSFTKEYPFVKIEA